MDADQELFAIFRAEVEEQIEDLCDLLQREPRRWRVRRLFQISHNVKGAARLVGVDSVRDVAHALEDLFSGIRDETLELDPAIAELARTGTDLLSASFAAMDSDDPPPPASDFRQAVNQALPAQELSPKDDVEPIPAPKYNEQDDPVDDEPGGTHQASASSSTLRVDTGKVETLLGLASEFVSLVFQAEGQASHARRLSERLPLLLHDHPELRADPEFQELERMARELGRTLVDHSASALRVSDELQSSVRTLRMVRIEGLRTLLNRSLREACRATERDAVLKISGGETEVDRAVLDQLRDPLVHLLRNAVAHGVEPRSERATTNKTQTATVELSARSAGSWVEISVSDDGKGVDAKQIRSHALGLKMVTQQELESMDDSAALGFLFEPGFSTAADVSDLAGRGVGLDVVKSHLKRLGGEASIKSTPGEGTRVHLRVPLTRLTTSGIIVRVGDQLFALSTSDVEQTLKVRRDDITIADGTEAVSVRGQLVRVIDLAPVLGYTSSDLAEMPCVVIGDSGRRRGVLVDEVLGQRDYILQQLSWNLSGASTVSGTAVLDGATVVLVLDSHTLLGARSAKGGAWSQTQEVRQLRILVVDDSATSRTLERNILRTAGYDVVTAIDGNEALDVLHREKIDLVISDVEMPVIDGFELTRRIRQETDLEQLPVVLVTSLGSDDHQRTGAEAGADAYIVKGAFDQDELLKTVARLL